MTAVPTGVISPGMATATTRPAPRSADAGRRVLLLHLVLSPLLFCTWTSDVFEGPKAALLTAAALVLAGLAASAWIARGAPLRLPARRTSSRWA